MSRVLLTESSSPMRFRVKKISESVQMEVDKNHMMIVRHAPATVLDEKNANGRVYSESVVAKSIADCKSRGLFENRQLLCTADDHPETTFPKPVHASHVLLDAYIETVNGQKVLFNDWLVLDTRNGQDFQALIRGGVNGGTSIRGLGRQDESTGEITEYEYLGTDVVGNPSAGTYAPFSTTLESYVESVPEELASNIRENIQTNSHEVDVMGIRESIASFKQKHADKKNLGEMISDVLTIERAVNFDSEEEVEILEAFKSEVLGTTPDLSVKDKDTSKAEEAKDSDIVNKLTRQLEASKVISSHLKTQNEQLLSDYDRLVKYKESSNKLISELVSKAKLATEELETEKTGIEKSKLTAVEEVKAIALKAMGDLQTEAKEIILAKETELEAALQFGNLLGSHFKALQAVCECLTERLVEKVASERVVETKAETVESKTETKVQTSKTKYNRYMMSTWKTGKYTK